MDGVTVFRDHADENQFWYLATEVALRRRPDRGGAAFSFIKYHPEVADAGVSGGGFLMFEAVVTPPSRPGRDPLRITEWRVIPARLRARWGEPSDAWR